MLQPKKGTGTARNICRNAAGFEAKGLINLIQVSAGGALETNQVADAIPALGRKLSERAGVSAKAFGLVYSLSQPIDE